LNALLFLLIGLEIAAIDLGLRALAATAVMILLALLIRWLSVAASALPINLGLSHQFGAFLILTWGGLRGRHLGGAGAGPAGHSLQGNDVDGGLWDRRVFDRLAGVEPRMGRPPQPPERRDDPGGRRIVAARRKEE
jgi:hypothetical protein